MAVSSGTGYAKKATGFKFHGQVTVGTTAVQITTTNYKLDQGVVIKADNDNSGNVYVGNSSGVTTSTGFRLKAGEGVFVEAENPTAVYVIADAASQKVHVLGV